MSLGSRASPSDTRLNLALWVGCLAGPVAWFLQLEITYAIAAESCGSKSRTALHLVTLLCLLLVAGGGWASWRAWGKFGLEWPSGSDEGITARVRFMGVLGLLNGLLSAVVIFAQWFAVLVLDFCPL